MSEIINNSEHKKELLKQLFLKLHKGDSSEDVKNSIIRILGTVPYSLVVEAEQELIRDGLPTTEIQKFCDLHSKVLEGSLDLKMAKIVPPGHPIDVFRKENKALSELCDKIEVNINELEKLDIIKKENLFVLKSNLNLLQDIDKHYRRKEYLVFPYLEKKQITGPPTVMWGKHDEIREKLKNAHNSIEISDDIDKDSFSLIANLFLKEVVNSVRDMIFKENEILLPMTGDVILESEWYEIHQQTGEYGYCIVAPAVEWKPKLISDEKVQIKSDGLINMPTGNFSLDELINVLNIMPFDITFVDKDDKVRYFSNGKHRIFDRSRAILMRDVRMCHPPHSVHIVDKIIEDFRSGKEDSAPFWINMGGKFIYIEYYAVRNDNGEYLGTLEVSQDLTKLRALEGEQRLLSYAERS